jgi:arabinogalactan endo-1,4-beta-galactosidase
MKKRRFNGAVIVFALLLTVLSVTARDGVCAEFIRGADISTHTRQVADGVVYNEYGAAKDLYTILRNHNLNWIRIRIFNNPSGSEYGVCQNLAYVTALGAQVKSQGYKFLLDFHYSDSWADPGQQTTPAAWSSYNHAQLVTAVHDYTRDVITTLRTNNAMPDMVQIGNEITNGMLWPDGQIYGSGSWPNFADLINAGITGVNDGRGSEPMPKIMIHIDRGGDWAGTQWFFDTLITTYGVQFDVIGQSFYPEWHGTLDNLANCLNNTAARYSQEIVVAEAGDYYTGSTGKTPESQKAFLEGVIQRVQAAPNGKGTGVFYWEPAWVWNSGVGYRALFQPISGNWQNVDMLMAMEAFDIDDAVPPSAPTGLSATAGNSTVSLNWNDNNETDLSGYNVYRSTTSGGPYSKLNVSLLTVSNYSDNSVSGGVTYYYVVRAVDTASNESDNSNQASATPTDTIQPAAPTGLTAMAGDSTVSLNWNDNGEPDINGYYVYRSTTSGGTYTRLSSTILTGSNYTDDSVTNGTTYYYVVTAVDTSSNESANSGEVSATPSPTTVYTFAGITAVNTNYNAYACDVDVFPFAGLSSNRNSQVEATDAQYANISADDTAEWATVDPSSSDEIFLWIEMKINEAPATISRIDLTFDGYTGGTTTATHRIFVLTAGADWTQTASWTQVGTDQSISPGTYAAMTRSITSNFSNYIDANSKITWAVYETTSSEAMHVNYLEMTVVGTATDTTPPATPAELTAKAGFGTVSLDWNNNGEGDLAGYNVYRSTTSGSGYSKQNNSLLTGSDYNDSNISNGTAYYYVVTAVDTSANESGYTSEVSATPINPPATGTGSILFEWWMGITGTAVSDLTSDVNYPDNSNSRTLFVTFEGPVDWADNYGTRIRGYVIPPANGNYTFWIDSNDGSELWLSTDDNPANAELIAYMPGSSQSSMRSLIANQEYYIEVLHKENTGSDNISVSWQGPGISQQVIDGAYLSPCCLDFRDFADLAGQWNRSDCNAGNNWCSGQDCDRDGNVQFDDLKTFAEEWLTGFVKTF